MPEATFEQRAAFLETHGNGGFRYASEVLTAIRGDGATEITCTDRSDSGWLLSLREIYRGRAEHLRTRGEEYEQLAIEVASLATALENAELQPVRIWLLTEPGGTIHSVFELLESRSIAGVVQSVDLRATDQSFFESLGLELPTTNCKRAGCERGRIEHRVFCRDHHFESIKGRPYFGS